MVRISHNGLSESTVTLRLEGRIVGPWVEEVRICCRKYLAQKLGVVLNISDVSFVDRNGIALLLDLTMCEVKLLNCPEFLALQMSARMGESGYRQSPETDC